jgi:hypothetical protein
MAVSKTWRHEAAAEIEHLGVGTDMSTHRHRRAGRDEASILDGEAFGERRARVRREHLAVEDDEVGGLGGGCARECKRNDRTRQIRSRQPEPQTHERYSPKNKGLRRDVAAL